MDTMNEFAVMGFRLGLGPFFTGWIKPLGRVMILTTIERESGRRQRAPVNYAMMRGGVYCVAGRGEQTAWFRDVTANPNVQVWIGNQSWAGWAEHVLDPHDWLPAFRQVMINSARPFMGIDPLVASNEKLMQAGADTPVVRINIERPAKAPADLVWVWPVAGAALGLLWWLAPRRECRENR